MSNLTLSLDDRLLADSQEYARRLGTTLDELVRDFLLQTVERRPGEAFAQMLADAEAMNLCSVDSPLRREEAHERFATT